MSFADPNILIAAYIGPEVDYVELHAGTIPKDTWVEFDLPGAPIELHSVEISARSFVSPDPRLFVAQVEQKL